MLCIFITEINQLLVQVECVRCPWLQAETKVATILGIGPSGVPALPLAAGINEGGYFFRYFSFLAPAIVVGFQSFAWAPN